MKSQKILLIGNSHSASIKNGWSQIEAFYSHVEFDYYVYRGDFFDSFSVDQEHSLLNMTHRGIQTIVEKLTGHNGAINFADYDLCLVVGAVDWWSGVNRKIYSKQVYEHAIRKFVTESAGVKLAEKIRAISSVPTALTHKPFPACRNPEANPSASRSSFSYLGELNYINETILFDLDVKIVEQPKCTIGSLLQTKLMYAAGYREDVNFEKFQGNESDYSGGNHASTEAPQKLIDDLVHMNSAFGAKLLIGILESNGISPSSEITKLPTPTGHLTFQEKSELEW